MKQTVVAFTLVALCTLLSFQSCGPGIYGACTTNAVFDTVPMALTDFNTIVPLGNINPTNHTVPTDHIYFQYLDPASEPTVLAPGNIFVTSIKRITNLNTATADFEMAFSPCTEITGTFGHMKSVEAAHLEASGGLDSCTSSEVSGVTYERCTASKKFFVTSGTILGKGGATNNLDFFVRDSRKRNVFLNSELAGIFGQAACAIDYYAADHKSTLEGYLGYPAGTPHTDEPKCGRIDWDLEGKARGVWKLEGKSLTDERNALTLAPHNSKNGKQTIGMGAVSDASANVHTFTPTASGNVNRDFAEVVPDDSIYCYDGLVNRFDVAASGVIVLIKLTSATTLSYEKQSAASCGSGPWAFSSATLFER